MWTKNKLKLVRSLTQKKHRDREAAFLAEGDKAIRELAARFHCRLLAATAAYLDTHAPIAADETDVLSEAELHQASALTTPHAVLAVFDRPTADASFPPDRNALTLALDGVQDPGNLGTIIRTADWFGIRDIVCSPTTADAFAPKVVQATMGALARVTLHYTELPRLLADAAQRGLPILGTFMDGENIYTAPLPSSAIIVMGNEGQGISKEVEAVVMQRLTVPSFPTNVTTVESLNVAIATSIVCAEMRRRVL